MGGGRTPGARAAWTHRTAVVLVPPEEVWPPLQEVRRARDRQFRRWMPHVTLLYPFAPRPEVPALLPPPLRAACARLAPFDVTLAQVRAFRHRGGSATLWLAPEPAAPLVALQAALQAAAPAFAHTSRFAAGFTPHLSVGQAADTAATEAALAELAATWRPLVFRAAEVSVLAREGDRPFEVLEVLRLGG
jgi:2'-5' RNA ligase